MSEVDSDELLLMAKLRPADTGLPMVVWVSERGHARHASRIKVAMVHGPRIDPGNTVRSSRWCASWPAGCRRPTCALAPIGYGSTRPGSSATGTARSAPSKLVTRLRRLP